MKLQVQKVKEGIKIYDENGGFIVITKEQAISLADVLIAATRS